MVSDEQVAAVFARATGRAARYVTQDEVQRGRFALLVVLGLQFGLALLVVAMALGMGRPHIALRRGIKLICELGLIRSLWNGKRWAQWFYTISLLAGAGLLIGVNAFARQVLPWPVVLTVSTILAHAAWLIGFSRPVNSYFAARRGDAIVVELTGEVVEATTPLTPQVATPAFDAPAFHAPLPECPCRECGADVPLAITWCPACGAAHDHAGD